jgi:hypothetical protein
VRGPSAECSACRFAAPLRGPGLPRVVARVLTPLRRLQCEAMDTSTAEGYGAVVVGTAAARVAAESSLATWSAGAAQDVCDAVCQLTRYMPSARRVLCLDGMQPLQYVPPA